MFEEFESLYKKEQYDKRLNNRHSVEKRRQTHATKGATSTHSIQKNSEERIGKINRNRAFGKN